MHADITPSGSPNGDLWQLYIQQNPATPTRTIDGESLVITPHDSTLHALNHTASFIWERADGSRRVCDIAAEMLADFDVDEPTATTEITDFVQDAVDRGLLLTASMPLPPLGA